MHQSIQPRRDLTAHYCLYQTFYFAACSGYSSFAVTYLMDRGFAAAQAGMMLALTSVCSCALQPVIGSYVDRRSMSLLAGIIRRFLFTALLSFLSIELLHPSLAVTAILFVLGSLTFSITVPLSSSLCAYYSQNGYHIDYGAGSGVGSLSFSFASLIIGYMIAARSSSFMMRFCLVFIIIEILMMMRYPKIEDRSSPSLHRASSSSLSLSAFCLRYRRFILTLLGVMLLAACHAMASSVETPQQGFSRLHARPFAVDRPIRRPVKLPGPAAQAIRSTSDILTPQPSRRAEHMGRIVWL